MPYTLGVRVPFTYLLLLSNFIEASHYSWGTTILAFLFRVLGQAIKPLQTDIGGCLLLLQSGACDSIKCIVLWIDDLSDEEVQQELGFPLAQKWS